jgi:hypothetical protein
MVNDLGNLEPQGIVSQQYKRLQAQIGLTILASIQLERLTPQPILHLAVVFMR